MIAGASTARLGDLARSEGTSFAARTATAALIAYAPVAVAAVAHGTAGWAAAVAAVAVLLVVSRVFDAESLVCALLPAAALTLSGFVQPASQYMALGTVGAALVGRYVLDRRGRPSDAVTPAVPRLVGALVVGYLAWAAVTTVSSIDRRTSLVYLAGMVLALTLAFQVVPATLGSGSARRRFLGTLVAVAMAAVAVTIVLAIRGPGTLYGAPFGSVLMVEPTVVGAPTGLVYPRVFGPYIDQGPYYTLVAAGLLASLALRASLIGGQRTLVTASGVILALATFLSFSRAAWLMALAGGLVLSAAAVWRRRRDWFAAALTGLFGLALVALLLNGLGGDARFDVQAARGWPAWVESGKLIGGEELAAYSRQQIRGGLSLTKRDELWAASVVAAGSRPVLGYGPGTDAAAIAPHLTDEYAKYQGISSHSGWLRTLVEMGAPGLLLLLAVWLAAIALAARGVRRAPAPVADVTLVAVIALAAAFLADETFEVYLLGGLGLTNLLAAVAIAMSAAAPGMAGAARR